MAINLKFDLTGNPEPPSIVLANRNGNKLGQLNVNVESIDVSDKFNAASEFSFTLNKYIDGELTPLWDKVVDFKLVYCPEWDLWFEIKVELDETTETVKTIFCTQLGQAELSQIKVYNIHINEEGDPNWDTNNETYKSTILYDSQNTDASLLHRLLKDKAPHYSIAYVDESIQRIQKTFSFDDTSICDAFDEIAEEIGCLFVYNSNSTKGGKPSRTISVYDLQQNCNDCGHRGEFTDKCPKCKSSNIKYGYGEDTKIFVTSDELATEGIQLVTDTDSVKNCFKLEGGDDLMTATIRNCNPNGSDYIWYFSDALKEDMSKELVEKLESYDEKYQDYYKNHISELNEALVNQYNALVNKYKEYYNTKSTCLDCNTDDYFYEQCPKCNSENILVGKKLQTISTKITGYSDLMTAYYNTIDLLLYLESGLMPKPDIETDKKDAKEQIELLTSSTLSPVAVNVKEVKNITEATAKSAVLSMAKILIKSTYKVDVVDNSSSLSETVYTDNIIGEYKKWTGKLVVTNYSNEEDSATSEIIEVFVGNDAKTFVEQKIEKALNKENTDDYSVTGLFAKEYDDFCVEIKKYALNPLDNFSNACDAVISILTEQGVGDDGSNEDNENDKATKKALYDALYQPYFEKQQAINNEIALRESEIAIIEGVWDRTDENNPQCITWGLQQYIEECQQDIQEKLDFEKYLGEDLWLEFCAYRREDKYSNSNYVSDGLNNAELFDRALEFIEVAEEEIFKSAELQHSISATLNNLLSLDKFKPLLKSFKTGNWIRVQVDDKVYKLRLLEYGFGYGDSESISVEFSDVTKIKNGITDVKEVLEQASSMASSYDSVQRQAEKGNVARSTIDQWLVDGLNAANMQIASNDSEEVLLTKSGLLARSYDDITGTYLPEQFKLTHNIMAYTDDNWKTVSSALGKHKYRRWNGSSFIDDEGYGLTSKFVTAGYITGSQIIGGEIVSSNYQVGESGTYLNLIKGDFDFAGGKIVYNADKNRVTLSGVEIQWDSVNTPTIENIDGLSSITEDIRIIEQGLSATTINGQYVISPNIIGGYLDIKNSTNNTGVVIDPNGLVNDDYIFRVYNGSTTAIGLDVKGNAEFSGTINGSHFIGGDLIIGDRDKAGDYAEIANDGKLTCTNVDILGGVLKIGRYQILDENDEPQLDEDDNPIYGWNTWIDENGILKTNESVISGTMYAGAGSIGSFTIEPVKDENGDTVGGRLYNSGKMLGEDKSIFLSATDMNGTMPFYNLIERTDENGDVVYDENDNVIYDVTASYIFKDDWRITVGSNFGVTRDGTAYMSNCEITGGSLKIGNENSGYHAWISKDGILNANGVNISGTINAIEGNIGGWYIAEDSLFSNNCIITSSNSNLYASLINVKETSPIRIASGVAKHQASYNGGHWNYDDISTNEWSIQIDVGYSSIYNVEFQIDTQDENHQNAIDVTEYEVDSNGIMTVYLCVPYFMDEQYINGINYAVTVTYYNEPTFIVLDDGSLYASAASITGDIYADNGTIGDLIISSGGLSSKKNDIILNNAGLTLGETSARIQVGDLTLGYNTAENATLIETSGHLIIRGQNNTQFELMKDEDDTRASSDVTIYYDLTGAEAYVGFCADVWLKVDVAPLYPITYNISWQGMKNNWGTPAVDSSGTISVTLNSGSIESSKVQMFYSLNSTLGVRFLKKDGSWTDIVSNGLNDDPVSAGVINHFDQMGSPNNLYLKGNLLPTIDSDSESVGYNLGGNSKHWNTIFARTSAIQTSDKHKKRDIKPLDIKYENLFDNLLPVSYKFIINNNNRTHIGLIAQDVKKAIESSDLTTQDFAGYCEWVNEDESIGCGLRYGEFIGMCIHEIQKLKKRVEKLENKLKTLE